MHPDIYITPTFSIHIYSLTIVSVIIIGAIVGYREAKRLGYSINDFIPTIFWGVLWGIIGAKVFDIIFFSWNLFLHAPWQTLTSASGWMYYGAEVMGFTGAGLYLWYNKLRILPAFDIYALGFAFSHAFGRVGCFMSGCCYGTQTDCLFGVTFPGMKHAVHPAQLYEAIPLFAFLIVVWIVRKKFTVSGTIFSIYLMYSSIERFIIEYFRSDAYEYGILHISPSRYISLCLATIGVATLLKITRNKNVVNNP